MPQLSPKLDLSSRERQILSFAATGLTDKEIARKLDISVSTVRSYWLRLRQKIGGDNRTEVVARSLETLVGMGGHGVPFAGTLKGSPDVCPNEVILRALAEEFAFDYLFFDVDGFPRASSPTFGGTRVADPESLVLSAWVAPDDLMGADSLVRSVVRHGTRSRFDWMTLTGKRLGGIAIPARSDGEIVGCLLAVAHCGRVGPGFTVFNLLQGSDGGYEALIAREGLPLGVLKLELNAGSDPGATEAFAREFARILAERFSIPEPRGGE
ncbi:MAG: helix-turn-helix transcriptional regulator [Fimbriimonadaceae bacterium]